jgi:hypothetical protein
MWVTYVEHRDGMHRFRLERPKSGEEDDAMMGDWRIIVEWTIANVGEPWSIACGKPYTEMSCAFAPSDRSIYIQDDNAAMWFRTRFC